MVVGVPPFPCVHSEAGAYRPPELPQLEGTPSELYLALELSLRPLERQGLGKERELQIQVEATVPVVEAALGRRSPRLL